MKEIRTDKKLEVERGREQFGSDFIQNDTSSGNWDESKHKRAADGKFGAGGGSGGGSGGGGGDEGGGDEGGGGDDDKKKKESSPKQKKAQKLAGYIDHEYGVDITQWESAEVEHLTSAMGDFLKLGVPTDELVPPGDMLEGEEPASPAQELVCYIDKEYGVDICLWDSAEVEHLSKVLKEFSGLKVPTEDLESPGDVMTGDDGEEGD